MGKRDLNLFMSYVNAKTRTKTHEKAFMVFVSDAVKNINESTANTFGGAYMKKRYIDILDSHEETRTGEEIINDIRNGLQELGE